MTDNPPACALCGHGEAFHVLGGGCGYFDRGPVARTISCLPFTEECGCRGYVSTEPMVWP